MARAVVAPGWWWRKGPAGPTAQGRGLDTTPCPLQQTR
uniref:Uncharacterized protein n=1 Tax=Arundo donax TaxID=35708 RepID=A0A0A9GS95_ARUDO